ncbi:MAG: hypothetical protein DMF74_10320, partial [Acidobacteria bacterium]
FGMAWTPDGRIVYASMAGGSWDIWITNANGSNQRKLADVNADSFPIISPDGRYVVFKSQRGEDTSHLYRMEMDGGSPRQLTSSNDHAASFSPDGQWVIYSANDGKHLEALWKVSIDAGTPVRLTDYKSQWPDVSPDGRLIVCDFLDEGTSHPQWRVVCRLMVARLSKFSIYRPKLRTESTGPVMGARCFMWTLARASPTSGGYRSMAGKLCRSPTLSLK